jgi:hypothetical protein
VARALGGAGQPAQNLSKILTSSDSSRQRIVAELGVDRPLPAPGVVGRRLDVDGVDRLVVSGGGPEEPVPHGLLGLEEPGEVA